MAVVNNDITSKEGVTLYEAIKLAYSWKEKYQSTNDEFMAEMSQLFVNSQEHLTQISSSPEFHKEADAIVNELIALRTHWGPSLFPPGMTALARERIHLMIGEESKPYRIDSAQYFEPVPYYADGNVGGIMKLYRFSVYDLTTGEIVMRYFLERSNVLQLYHVLCFADVAGGRGQIAPYGMECPSYWVLREKVIENVTRLYSNN